MIRSKLTAGALALALAGTAVIGSMSPSEARSGRNAALGVGLAAGAVVGAGIAASANNGYYHGDRGYYDGYAYAPAPVYSEPVYAQEPVYVQPRGGRCWVATDRDRGFGYWGRC
jgi:hypothetical protein